MSFLLAARTGRNGFWRYAAGVFAVIVLYAGFSFAAVAVLFGASGEPPDATAIPTLPLGSFGPAATLAVVLMPAVAVLIGVVVSLPVIHRRDPATLVRATRPLRWRRAVLAGAVWAGVAGVYEAVAFLLYPASYTWTFDAARFAPLLVVALGLLPLQSAGEELFFRGYLMQGFGLALGRGWPALLVTSVLFAAVHASNPELERFGRGFLVYYAGIGLVLGLMALLDEGLEVAIGAHTANNLWGALVVSFPGSVLDTPALVRMDGVPPAVMATLGAATAVTSLVALGVLLDWGGRWRLLGPLEPPEPPAPEGEGGLP